MKTKPLIVHLTLIVVLSVCFAACAGVQPRPDEQNFRNPVVTLSHVEVSHYWGWWYFKKTIAPAAGAPGDYGAPLDLAFVFEIQNPNDYPVEMKTLKFTVAFEEFDLNTVSSEETQWIPAGKTNQLRVHAMFDGQQSMLSLLVTGGFKLKEKGLEAGPAGALQQLGKWWEGIPEFSFPVHVKEGTAIFGAETVSKSVTFGFTYP
ncbi:MAG: hypothetical protein ACOZF0_21165 [Thermodesulfobacteriota bacterium]